MCVCVGGGWSLELMFHCGRGKPASSPGSGVAGGVGRGVGETGGFWLTLDAMQMSRFLPPTSGIPRSKMGTDQGHAASSHPEGALAAGWEAGLIQEDSLEEGARRGRGAW